MGPMSSVAPSTQPRGAFAPAARADGFRRVLPNALTIFRVVLAGAFFVLLSRWSGVGVSEGRRPPSSGAEVTLLVSAVLFVVAALTDALDGWLSRRWNVTSVFGRVMDPFADKVLIIGAFIYLAGPAFRSPLHTGGFLQVSGVAPWMVVVILARELLVTSIRGVVEGRGGNFQANAAGKIKMIVQAAAVPTVLAAMSIFDTSPQSAGRALIDGVVWIAVAVSALSGVPYVVRGIRALRDAGPET